MRKVEKQMLEALKAGKNFSQSNTVVKENGEVYLHGNLIAIYNRKDGTSEFSLAGFPTATTRSLLRALGIRIFQKKWEQYIEWESGRIDVASPYLVFLADKNGRTTHVKGAW